MMPQQQTPSYTPPSIEEIIRQVQSAAAVDIPPPPSVSTPTITGKVQLPQTPTFSPPELPQFQLPQFPQYQLESPSPAPLYQTPQALQEYMQKFLELGYQRAQKGIELPEEYVTNLYRRATEQIAKQAEEARRKYNESLAARGLAGTGLAQRAEQQISETALGLQSQAVRDIEVELATRQMASMQEAYNQAVQVMQMYGDEAWKVYASKYQEWVKQMEFLQQKNQFAFQEAIETYGAQREKAIAEFQAGVNSVLQSFEANVNAQLAAYQAAAQQYHTILQGQITAQLNAQAQRYALQLAQYQAQLALAQMRQQQVYDLQKFYAQAEQDWNQMIYQTQAQAEAARWQGVGNFLGTIFNFLLLGFLL